MTLQKGQPPTFDGLFDKEITALETLDAKLMESPLMALPRSQGDYTVDTEACDKGIGCVVLQKQPDRTD